MAVRATVVADGTDIVRGGSMDPVSQPCLTGSTRTAPPRSWNAANTTTTRPAATTAATMVASTAPGSTCKRNNGLKLLACHHPADPGARLRHHTIHVEMSDQHR
jgi:hypothetical protein